METKKTNTSLVKIDASEFGIEESKAKQIQEQFQPMLDKMVNLEKQANEVFKLPIETASAKAKEVRLQYVKVRTGTAEIHKEQKAFYLQAGRFVDGWKNAQLFASQGIEKRLLEIERHDEIQEQKRIVEFQNARANQLLRFEVEVIPENLGSMSNEVWCNFILGIETNYNSRKEAEAKAEQERLGNERRQRVHNERRGLLLPLQGFVSKVDENDYSSLSELEFQQILKLAKEAKTYYEAEQERIRQENIRLQKEKQIADQKAEQERLKHEAELKEIQDAQQIQLEKQRAESNKLKAELLAKEQAEAKATAEREARQEAELRKGDAAKIKDLATEIKTIKTKYTFKSQKNKKAFSEVQRCLEAAIAVIESEKITA